MPINKQSNYLTILIATHNRLEALKVAINAIQDQTKCSHEIIVIDGGSTDGTIEYLKSRRDITPVFQGKLLGVPRSYNEVWRQVESKYTAWLSDDTELTNHGLDLAVQILENDPEIGMVGLKTRDVIGPRTVVPYVGALSMYRILNCNHGVMPTEVVRSVGFFNEDYPMYMIDPDLTASILCAGKKVVMTKPVCVLHRPEWAISDRSEKKASRLKGVDHFDIYGKKFSFLSNYLFSERLTRQVRYILKSSLVVSVLSNVFKLNSRDIKNLRDARFISPFDPIKFMCKTYHNVQEIPRSLLMRDKNPYRILAISDDIRLK